MRRMERDFPFGRSKPIRSTSVDPKCQPATAPEQECSNGTGFYHALFRNSEVPAARYTRQRFLQLVSKCENHMRLREHLHGLVRQIVATHVAEQMIHYARLQKFVAMLLEPLRKVELDSRNGRCKVCYMQR